MAKTISEANAVPNVSDEAIARRAYEIWEGEGRPNGRAMEHWLLAVSELQTKPRREEREAVAPREPRSAQNATPRLRDNRFKGLKEAAV